MRLAKFVFTAPIIFTVWDKDRIGKEFLGRIVIPLAECPHLAGATLFDDPNNKEIWNPLNTRTARDIITGDICIKLGFVGDLDPDIQHMLEDLDDSETAPGITFFIHSHAVWMLTFDVLQHSL